MGAWAQLTCRAWVQLSLLAGQDDWHSTAPATTSTAATTTASTPTASTPTAAASARGKRDCQGEFIAINDAGEGQVDRTASAQFDTACERNRIALGRAICDVDLRLSGLLERAGQCAVTVIKSECDFLSTTAPPLRLTGPGASSLRVGWAGHEYQSERRK
jgi:hypothetical protein